MPTYEYKCLDCGYKVEYFQWMTEKPKTECPSCKGHLQRMVTSGAGLIFKGSGFYITDYKHKDGSYRNGNGNGKTPAKPETAVPDKEKADNTSSKAD